VLLEGPGPGLGTCLDRIPRAAQRRGVGQVQVADRVKIAAAAMSTRLAISAFLWPNSCMPSSRPVARSPVTRMVMRWLPG